MIRQELHLSMRLYAHDPTPLVTLSRAIGDTAKTWEIGTLRWESTAEIPFDDYIGTLTVVMVKSVTMSNDHPVPGEAAIGPYADQGEVSGLTPNMVQNAVSEAQEAVRGRIREERVRAYAREEAEKQKAETEAKWRHAGYPERLADAPDPTTKRYREIGEAIILQARQRHNAGAPTTGSRLEFSHMIEGQALKLRHLIPRPGGSDVKHYIEGLHHIAAEIVEELDRVRCYPDPIVP